MPEIFRFYGFSFFFYSRKHEPIHIHVEGKDGMAKFRWNGSEFASDYRKIKAVIDENADIIISQWNEHFKR